MALTCPVTLVPVVTALTPLPVQFLIVTFLRMRLLVDVRLTLMPFCVKPSMTVSSTCTADAPLPVTLMPFRPVLVPQGVPLHEVDPAPLMERPRRRTCLRG